MREMSFFYSGAMFFEFGLEFDELILFQTPSIFVSCFSKKEFC